MFCFKFLEMLRPSALRKLLSQVVGGSIQATILLTRSGEILDYSVKNEKSNVNVKNISAIICSVFQGFQKLNNPLSDSLNCLIVEVELYRVIVRPVGNHLVCICADSNTGLGILKLKLNSLTESLNRL